MKKVFSIIALSLVGILVVTTVVLACVTTCFYTPINESYSSSIETVRVYYNGTNYGTYRKGSTDGGATFSKILKYQSTDAKQNVLISLFGGAYNFDSKITALKTGEKTITLTTSGNNYLVFQVDGDPVLKFNGSPYYIDDDDTTVTINYLIVTANNTTDSLKEITTYVVTGTNTITESTSSATVTASYKITSIARQKDLVNYISSLSAEQI